MSSSIGLLSHRNFPSPCAQKFHLLFWESENSEENKINNYGCKRREKLWRGQWGEEDHHDNYMLMRVSSILSIPFSFVTLRNGRR